MIIVEYIHQIRDSQDRRHEAASQCDAFLVAGCGSLRGSAQLQRPDGNHIEPQRVADPSTEENVEARPHKTVESTNRMGQAYHAQLCQVRNPIFFSSFLLFGSSFFFLVFVSFSSLFPLSFSLFFSASFPLFRLMSTLMASSNEGCARRW